MYAIPGYVTIALLDTEVFFLNMLWNWKEYVSGIDIKIADG
tara:strand:- start:420 stop:542 length:123 start_codon:yes stop_codon:yes gene_type:complete